VFKLGTYLATSQASATLAIDQVESSSQAENDSDKGPGSANTEKLKFEDVVQELLPSFGWLALDLSEFGLKSRELILAAAREPQSTVKRIVDRFCDHYEERRKERLTPFHQILLLDRFLNLKRV